MIQSGLRSLGMGLAWGGPAICLLNFWPVPLAPRKKDPLWKGARKLCNSEHTDIFITHIEFSILRPLGIDQNRLLLQNNSGLYEVKCQRSKLLIKENYSRTIFLNARNPAGQFPAFAANRRDLLQHFNTLASVHLQKYCWSVKLHRTFWITTYYATRVQLWQPRDFVRPSFISKYSHIVIIPCVPNKSRFSHAYNINAANTFEAKHYWINRQRCPRLVCNSVRPTIICITKNTYPVLYYIYFSKLKPYKHDRKRAYHRRQKDPLLWHLLLQRKSAGPFGSKTPVRCG